ncbi:MAG TPA: hypothetical protein VGH05_20860, partial [Buttiauxella sp.]
MSNGFLSLKNNSNVIIGKETSFTSEVSAGDFIFIEAGGVGYTLPVDSIESDTELTTLRKYTGPTVEDIAWVHIPRKSQNMIYAKTIEQMAEISRHHLSSERNWNQLLTVNGDVTIKNANGSEFTGPSWPKIAEIAENADLEVTAQIGEQVRTDAAQVSEDKNAAAESARQAAESAEKASVSEQGASDAAISAQASAEQAVSSEQSASDSAEKANEDADRAEAAANRAETGLPPAKEIWEALGVNEGTQSALNKPELDPLDFKAVPLAPDSEGHYTYTTVVPEYTPLGARKTLARGESDALSIDWSTMAFEAGKSYAINKSSKNDPLELLAKKSSAAWSVTCLSASYEHSTFNGALLIVKENWGAEGSVHLLYRFWDTSVPGNVNWMMGSIPMLNYQLYKP